MHFGNDTNGVLTLQEVYRLREISDRLADGGTVVLRSCSAGKGEESEVNMANAFAEVFTQARHVFAPQHADFHELIFQRRQ